MKIYTQKNEIWLLYEYSLTFALDVNKNIGH
jgi:hypothetical protein